MKKSNMFPSIVNNTTIKDWNDTEANEISNNELEKTIRMINEIKEDMYMYLNKFKEVTNKQMNELIHVNEIRKTMKDMQEKIQ
jgi:hypothetical protein